MAEQYQYFPPYYKIAWDLAMSTLHSTLVEYALDGSRQAKGFFRAAGIRKRSFTTQWLQESDRAIVSAFLNAQRGQLGKWYLYDPGRRNIPFPSFGFTITDTQQLYYQFPLLAADPVTGGLNGTDVVNGGDLSVYWNTTHLPEYGFPARWTNKSLWQAKAVSAPGPFNITTGVNDIFNMSSDNYTTVNFTLPGGSAVTAATIASALSGVAGPTMQFLAESTASTGRLWIFAGSIGGFPNDGWFQINHVTHSCDATLSLPTTLQKPDGDLFAKVFGLALSPGDVISVSCSSAQERLLVALLADEIIEQLFPNLATAAWSFKVPVREVI